MNTSASNMQRHLQRSSGWLRSAGSGGAARAGLLLTVLISIVFIWGCEPAPEPVSADDAYAYVSEWLDGVYGLITVERTSPPRAARTFGYLGVSLYEGWVHGLPDRRSAVGVLNELDSLPEPDEGRTYDWPVVAATAAHDVMEHLFQGTTGSTLNTIDDLRDRQIERRRTDSDVAASVIERSEEYGRDLGAALIEWADSDGYHETRGRAYTPPTGPDQWVPTAEYGTSLALNPVLNMVHLYDPEDRTSNEGRVVRSGWQSDRMMLTGRLGQITDHNVAMEPYWGELRTFLIGDPVDYPPIPPMEYSEDPSSPFHEQVMAVYRVGVGLTEEQARTAHFWADNPGETGTPGGHWMRIASQVMRQQELSVADALELTLLTSISVADSFIACWYAKYEINLVRPKTLINRWIDPEWQDELVTPPFPEYPSGHSTVSGAAATSLTALLGEVGFEDHTHVNRFGFDAREYGSFAEAGQEAAHSRLYGGIHYPMANQNGLEHGERIGRTVAERLLSHTRGQAFPVDDRLPESLFSPIPPPGWDGRYVSLR